MKIKSSWPASNFMSYKNISYCKYRKIITEAFSDPTSSEQRSRWFRYSHYRTSSSSPPLVRLHTETPNGTSNRIKSFLNKFCRTIWTRAPRNHFCHWNLNNPVRIPDKPPIILWADVWSAALNMLTLIWPMSAAKWDPVVLNDLHFLCTCGLGRAGPGLANQEVLDESQCVLSVVLIWNCCQLAHVRLNDGVLWWKVQRVVMTVTTRWPYYCFNTVQWVRNAAGPKLHHLSLLAIHQHKEMMLHASIKSQHASVESFSFSPETRRNKLSRSELNWDQIFGWLWHVWDLLGFYSRCLQKDARSHDRMGAELADNLTG